MPDDVPIRASMIPDKPPVFLIWLPMFSGSFVQNGA